MNTDAAKPLIIAHRGASALAPENTLAAFQKAIDGGADGIEFDVRLVKDGVAVVFHDPTLKRTGLIEGQVADLTSKELGKIDVGSWFNRTFPRRADENYSKQFVPTLASALRFLKHFDGLVYIELKCRESEVETLARAVCKDITSSNLSENIIVKSFRLAVIPHIRQACPGVRTAALFAPKIMNILRKEKHLVTLAAELGANELSLHYSLATRKLMKRAERAELPVTIWTADNPRWIKRAIRLGLKAIITNNPERLIARRNELFEEK